MKKRMLLTAATLALCAALIACGGETNENKNDTGSSTTTDTATETVTTPVTEPESVTEFETEPATETASESETMTETGTETETETGTETETESDSETESESATGTTENTRLFTSNVASQKAGTDLQSSDLAKFFSMTYGIGDQHAVQEVDGELRYVLGQTHEMFAYVDGSNAYTVDMAAAGKNTMAIVRGVRILNPIDRSEIAHVINNYYEEDGDGALAGGGICARISDGQLYLTIKTFDSSVPRGIKNQVLTYNVDSTVLTFADDAEGTVYILAGDKLITTVKLSGSVNYFDFFEIAMPITSFAARAEVIDAEGNTVTYENTLIADHPTQVAVAVRGHEMQLRSIEVSAYADVTIPDELYRPENTQPTPSKQPVTDLKDVGSVSCDGYFENGVRLINDGKAQTWLAENRADGIKNVESIQFYGWAYVNGETTVAYGYVLDDDGIEKAVWNADWASPDLSVAEIIKNDKVTRFNIPINWSNIESGEHTLHLLIKTEEGTVAELTQWGSIKLIKDDTGMSNTFKSNVASNEVGTIIATSDLCNYFTWKQGNPNTGTGSVNENGSYSLGSINQIFAAVQGSYAFTVDADIVGASATFVRGVNYMTSVVMVDGVEKLKNLWYYEQPVDDKVSTDLLGGSGISAFIKNGKLNLLIKTYDATQPKGIGYIWLNDYEVSGTEWTLADDGQNTIYVLAGDQLIYTITLSGETTYDSITCYASDETTEIDVKFAATATITDKDGNTTTVENTLVATTPTQVAAATRSGASSQYRSIEVKEFAGLNE